MPRLVQSMFVAEAQLSCIGFLRIETGKLYVSGKESNMITCIGFCSRVLDIPLKSRKCKHNDSKSMFALSARFIASVLDSDSNDAVVYRWHLTV